MFFSSECSFNDDPQSFFQIFVATESGVMSNIYYAIQSNVHSDGPHKNDAMSSKKTSPRVRLQEGH